AAALTASLVSGSFFVNCQPIVGPDPINGSFTALYDNTAGSAPGAATVVSAELALTAPNQSALTWSFAVTPTGSGQVGAGQTATMNHSKTPGSGGGSDGASPCSYCGGSWTLTVAWNAGSGTLSDSIALGSVSCVF